MIFDGSLMDRGKARSIKSGLRAIEILSEDEFLPTIENRLQQLFSIMNSENVLQRDHLPRKSNEGVFLNGPTFLLLVFAHAILLDRQKISLSYWFSLSNCSLIQTLQL
ncbi:hypothetical protein T12_6934 [Trichinella patagoniensis]|uniref:Uncharacterized protein n=1 Tax=Trichinella patagoniensis TaxID=990121 RepID=A0A0V0Z061_9BILA|nr:hypothetical protein T12_6934 [Trichinella patagoniensis]